MPGEPTNSIDTTATRTVGDIPCPFCACLCDDLQATVRGGKIVSIAGACEAARPWFLGERPSGPPECRVDGRPADLKEAIDRAAERLAAAQYPLVYGLRRATCEGQRIAVEIAELLQGVLDVPLHRGALEALQSVGEVSCTFGEVRNRADLIVVWNADLAATHPRFIERFVRREPAESGRESTSAVPRVIAIDSNAKSTVIAALADERIVIREGSEVEAATSLRAIVKGAFLDAAEVARRTGIALEAWRMLAIQMKQARYGVLLTADSGDDSAAVRTREALAALVRELNEYTRFALLELPSAPNVVGAMNVVAWRSGYQPPIDFWRGDPTSNAAAFTAEKLLNSGEIDAALVICDDLFGRMNESATRALASIPIVALDWRQTSTTAAARIAIPLALPGVESGGTLFRGDGIPLALRPPINSQLPTDHDALQSLKAAICLRKSEK